MKSGNHNENAGQLRSECVQRPDSVRDIKTFSLKITGPRGYKRTSSSNEDRTADEKYSDNHHDDARHDHYEWSDGDRLAGGGLWTKRSGNLISSAKRSQTNPHQTGSGGGFSFARDSQREGAMGTMNDQKVIILKFGSSVLRSEGDLPNAVHEMYRYWREGAQVIAVVSAFGDTTDQLMRRAERV